MTESLKKWLLGNNFPSSTYVVSMLGFWVGILPEFCGFHVIYLLLVLCLNLNLLLFALSVVVGKLVCLLAPPLLFYVGKWAVENNFGLVGHYSSIPILAIADFSKYAVIGAAWLGPALGTIYGGLMILVVTKVKKMSTKPNASDENPVVARQPFLRKGVLLILILFILISSVVVNRFGDQWIAQAAQPILSKEYGAQVDFDALDVALLDGTLQVRNIAATDLDDPMKNKVVVGQLDSKISLMDLAFGKVVLDQVVLSDIAFDQPRQTPGEIYPKPKKENEIDIEKTIEQLPGSEDVSGVLKENHELEKWLEQIAKWLPKVIDESKAKQKNESKQELSYLTERMPTKPLPKFIIKHISLDKIKVPLEMIGTSQLQINNVSDVPDVVGLPLEIKANSLMSYLDLKVVCHFEDPTLGTVIQGEFAKIDLAQLQKELRDDNDIVFVRGNVKGKLDGKIDNEKLNLKINAQTQGMMINTPGDDGLFGLDAKTTKTAMEVIDQLNVELTIAGPLTKPKFSFDMDAIGKQIESALVNVGKKKLEEKIDEEVKEVVDDILGNDDKEKEARKKKKQLEASKNNDPAIEKETKKKKKKKGKKKVLTEEEKQKKKERKRKEKEEKRKRQQQWIELGIGILEEATKEK